MLRLPSGATRALGDLPMKSILLRSLLVLSIAGSLPLACGGNRDPNTDPNPEPGPSEPPPDDGLCETNEDCTEPAQPVCDGFIGCVECVLDDHCAEGLKCEENACVAPQACASSVDCTMPGALFCNHVLGECAECVSGPECGQNHICNQGTCEEVSACVNSLDCPDGEVCDRDLSYCVDCIADGDCEETEACVASECIPRCDSDKDCTGAGELCNQVAGYCVECVENVDCPDLYHCDRGSCNVDICIAGESSCNDILNAREVCSPDGSEINVMDCSFGTTCVESGEFSTCTPWTCSPGSASCSQDGSALLTCDADGLGATTQTDCTALGGVCENNACVAVVCDAGQKFCSEGTVMQCSASGTSFTSTMVCGPTEHCDEEAQGCTLNICTPNTTSCDGTVLKTCNADGSGFLSEETDCTDSDQVCFNNACRAQICEADAPYCKNGESYTCQDLGSREQLNDDCNTLEYCDDGVCKARVCTPNQAVCDGDVTGVCKADGSGVDTSEGTDCGALDDQVCWNGACEALLCDINKDRCDGQDRVACINNGTATQVLSTCSASYYCTVSENVSACAPRICTANAPACDGNRATTCNANGSGYSAGGTTCDVDEFCVSGTCLPVICSANAYYCQGGNVQRCGPDGTTSTLQDTCSAGEFCQEGTSTCRVDTCTANQPACNGALLSTCLADGSAPAPGGTACAEGQTCDAGSCKTVFCTPGNQYCEGTYRRTCNATGTGYSATTTCGAAYYCSQVSSTTTECAIDICNPSSATCNGETLATCGADGGSYTSPGTDCSATDQLCTGTTCADSVTETTGGTTTANATYCNNYRLGNHYVFTSSRTLTEIRQYLNITGTIQLSWVIYELDSASEDETYTKVFEKLTTSSGLQYHSSGAISFDVAPNKQYVIGVRPAGACTAYYGGLSGKNYLASGGYLYYRDYVFDSGALETDVYSSIYTYGYAQQLVFE
jgi:hypothetical protein